MNAPSRHKWQQPGAGFTLVELLLAAALGTLVCGGLLQLLLGDLRLSAAMAQKLQARRQQQQVLTLIRAERDRGYGVIANPDPSQTWPCALAGRRAVLAIALSPADPNARHQAIVYSVGAAPSPIWRGQVLMRCGPAYGLDGRMDPDSRAQNRVVLDALPSGDQQGLRATADPQLPVIDLQLEQELLEGSGQRTNPPKRLSSSATL